jgi:ABC-type transport system substrate-binding protein
MPAEATAQNQPPVISITTLNWFPMDYQTATVLNNQLTSVGLRVQLIEEGSAELYPQVYSQHNFTSYVNAWAQAPFPKNMFSFWQTWNDYSSGNNIYGFHNSTMDQLTNSTQSAPNQAEFLKGLYKMQQVVQQQVVVIPLFTDINTQLVSTGYAGYVPMAGGEFTLYNIWTVLNLQPSSGASKGTFTIALPSDIQTTNWFNTINLRDEYFLSLIYDSLLKYSPKMDLMPWLASNYTISPDGLTYSFNLRSNVTFHDGTPLTAQDVAFTYMWALQNKAPYVYPYINMIQSVDTPGNYAVVFHLSKPYPGLIYEMATIPIVAKHIYQGQNVTFTNPTPIGSGPFMWHQRVPGSSIELVANPQYWMKGYPKLGQLNFIVVADESIRILDIEKGVADAELYATPPNLATQAVASYSSSLRVIQSPDLWSVWLMFNLRQAPVNNLALRQAIAYAINRTQIIQSVLNGYGYPQDGPLSPQWNPSMIPPNLTTYQYNPTLARSILMQNGFLAQPSSGISPVVYGFVIVGVAVVILAAGFYLRSRRRQQSDA